MQGPGETASGLLCKVLVFLSKDIGENPMKVHQIECWEIGMRVGEYDQVKMTGAIYTRVHEHMVILLKQKIIFGIEWEKEQ